MLNEMLVLSRRLAFVPRWVVVPTIRGQNVAEHCFHVACATRWLLQYHATWDEGNGTSPLELLALRESLVHDEEEAITGDTPSTCKTRPDPSDLPQYKVIVKVADKLDALAFVEEERLLGNNYGTEKLLHHIKEGLHGYWHVFEKNAAGSRLHLTSDLARTYLDFVVSVDRPHPHMRGRT